MVLIVIFGVSKVSDRGTFKAKSLRKSGLKALLRRKAPDMAWQWVGECWVDVARIVHQSKLPYLGVGQNLLLSILMGWTSIYQLFWGSLGARVLTNSHFFSTKHWGFHHHLRGFNEPIRIFMAESWPMTWHRESLEWWELDWNHLIFFRKLNSQSFQLGEVHPHLSSKCGHEKSIKNPSINGAF